MALDYFFNSRLVFLSSTLLLLFSFMVFVSFFTTCNKAVVSQHQGVEECFLFGYIPLGCFPKESVLFLGLSGLVAFAVATIVLGLICQRRRKEEKTTKVEAPKERSIKLTQEIKRKISDIVAPKKKSPEPQQLEK